MESTGTAAARHARWRLIAALVLLMAGFVGIWLSSLATATPAAAQIPPTVPCTGCGPGPPGPGSGAYGYTEYVCEGGSRFLIFAGVNLNTTEAVTYTITYSDVDAAGNPIGPTTTIALGVLQPGQHVPNSTTIWQIPHAPGVPQRVQISGIGVTTGRRYVSFDKVIVCECPVPPTTSSNDVLDEHDLLDEHDVQHHDVDPADLDSEFDDDDGAGHVNAAADR